MKRNMWVLISVVCVLFMLAGCQRSVRTGGNSGAEIAIERTVHNCGRVAGGTKISFEPERIVLSLEKANANCPNITLAALDGQAFSIESIYSTGECITADFDPAEKAD